MTDEDDGIIGGVTRADEVRSPAVRAIRAAFLASPHYRGGAVSLFLSWESGVTVQETHEGRVRAYHRLMDGTFLPIASDAIALTVVLTFRLPGHLADVSGLTVEFDGVRVLDADGKRVEGLDDLHHETTNVERLGNATEEDEDVLGFLKAEASPPAT